MEVRFNADYLDRLEVDPRYTARLPPSVAKAYRKVLGWIRAAPDERDFYNLKSLHFERLVNRPGQHSLRLNDQFRLIVEFEGEASDRRIVIVSIEDYH